MKIEPTVGRHVHYQTTQELESFPVFWGAPLAAIIARVNDDGSLNLCVFDSNGFPHAKRDVVLRQPDETFQKPFAEWMPWQVGQQAAENAKQLGAELEAIMHHPV